MKAGSVMLFDSALWHGGGANNSDERRFAFSCAYCWGWMRQQENLQLGIPQETAKRFPRRLQELCGYSVYKGQFGHIDNHDPIELLGRERGKRMVWEATDARKARMAARRSAELSPSFRGDAKRRTRNPTICLRCGTMDSGFALRAPRNDDGESYPFRRNRKYAATRPSRSALRP